MYQFEKMDKKLLGDRIADELMRYILEEPVEVGRKLPNEFDLAKRFGVGRKLRYQSGVLRLFSEHAASSMKGACLED